MKRSLSFFVPPGIWVAGVSLVAAGLVWKTVYTNVAKRGVRAPRRTYED